MAAHFDPPCNLEHVPSLRDKDYVRTRDGLLFNVIGYHHVPGAATANLKYVDGVKWELGYSQARDFLSERFPHYVDGDVVRVRESHVVERFRTQGGPAAIARASGSESVGNDDPRIGREVVAFS